MKNKIVAGLLAFFLGGLGIHWFYLNKNSKGIAYLLTTVLGCIFSIFVIGFIPLFIICVLVIIDFLSLISMDEKVFNEKYNS